MSFKRKSIILVLFLIAGISSALTFAYWSSVVNSGVKSATGTIQIGEGQATETVVVVEDQEGGILVPAKFANTEHGTVDEVVLEFPVEWKSAQLNAASGAIGELVAFVKDVKIDEIATFADLVNYEVIYVAGQEIMADGYAVTVQVKFTLNEPANKEQYDHVANKRITANIMFNVVHNVDDNE